MQSNALPDRPRFSFDNPSPSTPTVVPMFSSPPPSPATSTSLFNFDSNGTNIILNCNSNRIIGKVAAQSMAQASPVWKMFFFPPWNQPQNVLDTPASAADRITQQGASTPNKLSVDEVD